MLDKCQQLTHVELLSHFSRDFTAKKHLICVEKFKTLMRIP